MLFQLLGVVTIVFFLVRLIPGNPAHTLAGPGARPETIQAIEQQLGLDKPIPTQYVIYLGDLIRGDLGQSIFTGQPVAKDIAERLPATLELVTTAMFISVAIGIPLGIFVALRARRSRDSGGLARKGLYLYGMLSGALPDFWLGLILVYFFFFVLGWAPAPTGRIGVLESPPSHVTGSYLVDSLITLDFNALLSAAKHLVLPVFTLVFVYMGNIVKMARSSMDEIMQSEFIEYARACGLPRRTVTRYAVRNALPPVVTVVTFTYGFLLGGAVLVEKVFSWGGLGQYVVDSLNQGDFAPVQGFVLVVAAFMVLLYLTLDVVYALLDPRIELA